MIAPPTSIGGTYSLSNTSSVIINDSFAPPTISSPYPSTITVTGLTAQVIGKVTVTLHGFSHAFPSDVAVLLMGPQGQTAILMAETGGQMKLSVTNLTFTLDDDAAAPLPVESHLTNGTFRPVNAYPFFGLPTLPFDFPAPAPEGHSNSSAALSVFKSTDPNGTWQLFVADNVTGDTGVISGGWTLTFACGYELKMVKNWPNVLLSWPTNAQNYRLQATGNPSLPSPWQNIITQPVIISNRYTVTNQIIFEHQFYRLLQHQ